MTNEQTEDVNVVETKRPTKTTPVKQEKPREVMGMEIAPGETKTDKEIEDDILRADARNALIAALDTINPGHRNAWAISASDAVLLFGESCIRDGKLRPGYEYKGRPVELEE